MRSLVVLLVALYAAPAAAVTYVVAPDGTGDAATIQAAIVECAHGDIIELRDGTFVGDGNRDLDLMGKSIVLRSESGDRTACIIDCQGTSADPHRGLVMVSGEGSSTVVEDLTITGGYADDDGGAVYLHGTSPTFLNCVLVRNTATGDGGAVWTRDGYASFVQCRFEGNDATWGGALNYEYSSPSLEGCEFIDNHAGSPGGGTSGVGAPVFRNCRFINNRSEHRGGAMSINCQDATVEACLFERNQSYNGAAIYATNWCHSSATLYITRCIFLDNWSSQRGAGIKGGEFEGNFPNTIAYRCTFHGNYAGMGGGAVAEIAGVEQSIMTHNEGVPVYDGAAGTWVRCSNLHGNVDGDWVDGTAGLDGVDGNFSRNPRYCGAEVGDFHLCDVSTCLPGQHPDGAECGTIGALGEGCPCAVPAVEQTWGRIKSRYRTPAR